jgi:hypothetical protein
VSLVLQVKQIAHATVGSASWLNGLVSLILLGLALILVVYAARAWKTAPP